MASFTYGADQVGAVTRHAVFFVPIPSVTLSGIPIIHLTYISIVTDMILPQCLPLLNLVYQVSEYEGSTFQSEISKVSKTFCGKQPDSFIWMWNLWIVCRNKISLGSVDCWGVEHNWFVTCQDLSAQHFMFFNKYSNTQENVNNVRLLLRLFSKRYDRDFVALFGVVLGDNGLQKEETEVELILVKA